jgi:hypothetical protein
MMKQYAPTSGQIKPPETPVMTPPVMTPPVTTMPVSGGIRIVRILGPVRGVEQNGQWTYSCSGPGSITLSNGQVYTFSDEGGSFTLDADGRLVVSNNVTVAEAFSRDYLVHVTVTNVTAGLRPRVSGHCLNLRTQEETAAEEITPVSAPAAGVSQTSLACHVTTRDRYQINLYGMRADNFVNDDNTAAAAQAQVNAGPDDLGTYHVTMRLPDSNRANPVQTNLLVPLSMPGMH